MSRPVSGPSRSRKLVWRSRAHWKCRVASRVSPTTASPIPTPIAGPARSSQPAGSPIRYRSGFPRPAAISSPTSAIAPYRPITRLARDRGGAGLG